MTQYVSVKINSVLLCLGNCYITQYIWTCANYKIIIIPDYGSVKFPGNECVYIDKVQNT